MSRLDDLIQEYCPDGVEYIEIGELCDISRGIVISKQFIKENEGEYPVYSSQTENDGILGNVSFYKYDGEYLTWTTDGANAGSIFYRNGKFNITNVCGLLSVNNKDISMCKYLYYALSVEAPNHVNKGMGNAKLMSNVMAKIKVPLPALPVQREIVRILDEFTLLSAELAAELAARKKQYEYYRNQLLSPKKDVPQVKLKDIATVIRGGNFQKKDYVIEGKPCIHYGQIYTQYGIYAEKTLSFLNEDVFNKSKKAVKNDIIMAVTSENVEDVCKCVAWLGNDEIAVSGHTAIIHHNQNPKYLAYYFHTDDFYRQKAKLAHGTKVIEVTPDRLNDITIPLPDLQEQRRIVSILDRFDTLCNDISTGLPAEIEARQKQYEYYRDQLLTFKELK